jgi:2-hydroxycyclohexanecarboxyl-CoA dehydrogenase
MGTMAAVGDDLAGRRALVTGSGQGVGAAVAVALATAGAMVAVNDILVERAESQAAMIRDAGGSAFALPFDVTNFAQVTDAIAEHGPFEILVNNAGNAGGGSWPGMVPFAETSPEDWAPFLNVNLHGVLHCVRAALPGMIDSGWGRVVTIISDAGRVGEPNMAAYAAAKAGAAGLTRAVSKEVGRHGITANIVSLGTMRTPLTEANWVGDNPPGQALLRNYAIRRPGLPEDVALLVSYLASTGASWITGQTIPLNGGYSVAQ